MTVQNDWFVLSVDPLLDGRGRVQGAVHVIKNITDLKQVERQLHEQMIFMENIIETAQALIIVLNENLEVISINAFAAGLLGYERDELIGRKWIEEVIPQFSRDRIQRVLQKCLAGQRVHRYETPVLTRAGRELLISWDSAELRDAGGIVGIVTIGVDVTNRKEAEKVQRLAQLGMMVSQMAHEVNNPLMIIFGRAQLAAMEEIENAELKEGLAVIMSECRRAKEIIQRLLQFSRPSKGQTSPADISQTIDSVTALIEHQFSLNNITFVKDYSAGLPEIIIDEKQMHEVFMNLLTNARDAMPEGGIITIRTKADDGFIRIEFSDTGAGMPAEIAGRLFEPFFTTKESGTGLGLAICDGIIRAHNGEFRLESEPGKGTTAIIRLPVKAEGGTDADHTRRG